MPRGDGPFQVLAKIDDNAYKIDLPGEYSISPTFNVAGLSLFGARDDLVDLRANAFQEGGSDEDIKDQTQAQKEAQDPIQGIGGPMTRARAKKIQEALQQIVANLRAIQLYEGTQHLEACMRGLLVTCIACRWSRPINCPNSFRLVIPRLLILT